MRIWRKYLPLAVTIMVVLSAFVVSPMANQVGAWDYGINYTATCDGYGVSVNPETYYHKSWDRYVPVAVQVDSGGGWNSVPFTDGPHAWNASGQHNYEVKIKYEHQYFNFLSWSWYSVGFEDEGPFHQKLEKPDDCAPDIKNLNLTFMQPCEPAEGTPDQAEWRISNPNDFAVEVFVTKAGDGTVYGPVSVGPGNTFFYTPWGSQTLILHWDGGSKTKAGGDSYNGTSCYVTCSETVQTGPFGLTGWYNVGAPYSPTGWVDNGDGTFTRMWSQDQWKDYEYRLVDKYDNNHICSTIPGHYVKTIQVPETKSGSLSYKASGSCKGAALYEVRHDPDGTQVGFSVIDEYLWTDPFVLESHEFVGDGYDLTVNEKADCQDTHEVTFTKNQTCDGWDWTLFIDGQVADSGSGSWSNPFVLETHDYNVSVPTNQGELYDHTSFSGTIAEPEKCQQTHETAVYSDSSCDQYWGGYILDGNKVETFRGDWQDLYGPESVDMTVTVPTNVGELYGQTEFNVTVEKSESCIQCKITRVYPMASYIDSGAPEGYWQGPFGMGAGICNVIHPAGETPSLERVQLLCSLCSDQVDGGYLYTPDREFFDGWVVKQTCYKDGRYHTHYYYDGYNWDQYVRLGQFDDQGNRTCSRENGCADEIHQMIHDAESTQ